MNANKQFSYQMYLILEKFVCVKIHVRRAAGRGYSQFHLYMCICVTHPSQTKHDTDLKFSTHTHIDFI